MKRAPERTCVGCGTKRDKSALIRVVVGPDGQVAVDKQGTAPGRGAYLCNPGCLKAALKRKAFSRAFRGKAAPMEPEALARALGQPGLQGDEIGLDAAPRRRDAARKG